MENRQDLKPCLFFCIKNCLRFNSIFLRRIRKLLKLISSNFYKKINLKSAYTDALRFSINFNQTLILVT